MARNLQCGCLCHGSNGNRIGDEYFSCKGCYAANHMDHLPRKAVVTKAAPKRKPLKKPVDPLTTLVKTAAKQIMNNIADAAEATRPIKKFTPKQAATITTAIKETMEAVHVCGDGASCKHD
jgi:hypothetical protein